MGSEMCIRDRNDGEAADDLSITASSSDRSWVIEGQVKGGLFEIVGTIDSAETIQISIPYLRETHTLNLNDASDLMIALPAALLPVVLP